MTTGNHDAAFEELMALVDGELPAGRADRVRAHVRGRQECRRMEGEMRSVSSRLGRLPSNQGSRSPAVPTAFPSRLCRGAVAHRRRQSGVIGRDL